MADELAVWLYGERVAIIDRPRGRPRLIYTSEALSRYALGTPLLSLSMPVGDRRYTQGIVSPFLDGLIPEVSRVSQSPATWPCARTTRTV